MFAPRYFAPRYYAQRYWPPGIAIVVVEAAPSSVRKRRYIKLERLPDPAYIDQYIDEEILKQIDQQPEVVQGIIKEAIYQYEQTGEDEDVILIMFMLGFV